MTAIDSLIAQLRAEMASEIEAAYNRGFAAGADDMRTRILSAAQSPLAPPPPPEDTPVAPSSTVTASGFPTHSKPVRRSIDRAPRGAVTHMLDRLLRDHPGLTIVEVEGLAGQYDPNIALKSIGNTLRRYEGDKYKRDERSRWFLIGGDAEKETAAGSSPAADVFS